MSAMTHQELRRRLCARWFAHLSGGIVIIARSCPPQWAWLSGKRRRRSRFVGPLPDRRRRLYDPRRQRH
jgi:hypothetical protein